MVVLRDAHLGEIAEIRGLDEAARVFMVRDV
jgi:hypothetical protein